MINEIIYPESAEKLNLGAFLLTPVWLIVHKKYLVAILSIIPVLNIAVSIISLIYGGRWAWDSQDWESDFLFKEHCFKWNIIGSVATVLIILIILLF